LVVVVDRQQLGNERARDDDARVHVEAELAEDCLSNQIRGRHALDDAIGHRVHHFVDLGRRECGLKKDSVRALVLLGQRQTESAKDEGVSCV
jgi:hypothetical protein